MIRRMELGDLAKPLSQLFEIASKLSHPEVEVRINSYQGVNLKNGVDTKFYETLLCRLSSQTPDKYKRSSCTKVFIKRINEEAEVRRIVDQDNKEIYMTKHKPLAQSLQLDLVTNVRAAYKESHQDQLFIMPLKVAVANEVPCTQAEYQRITTEETLRIRQRTSFFFPQNNEQPPQFQIDITEVFANGTKQFQVELELLPQKEYFHDKMTRNFMNSLSVVFPNLHTIFTPAEYDKYANLLVIRGQAPVNIQARHITSGLQDYMLTNKLDGVAYSLFMHQSPTDPNHITFVLKNYTDCWVLAKIDLNKRPQSKGLLELVHVQARVEVVQHQNTFHLHLFDVTSSNTNFTERLKLLQRLESLCKDLLPYPLTCKTFIKITDIRKDIKSFIQDYERFAASNDGLVFQPIHTSSYPLKWKFPDKISVDFLFCKDFERSNEECTYYTLKTSNSARHTLFPVIKPRLPVKTKLLPRHTVDDLLDLSDVLKQPKRIKFTHNLQLKSIPYYKNLHDLVVECVGYPREVKQPNGHTSIELDYKLVKVRWDKTEPNNTKVALETCVDMLYRRDLSTLIDEIEQARLITRPNSSQFVIERYFRFSDIVYNQRCSFVMDDWPTVHETLEIQRAILNYMPNLTLLFDLNAGCGSFATAWDKRHVTVVCFESKYYKDLEENAKTYRFTSQSKLITVQSDEHSVIPSCKAVMKKLAPQVAYLDSHGHYVSSELLDLFPVLFVRTPTELSLGRRNVTYIQLRNSNKKLAIVSRVHMEQLRNMNNDLKQTLINKWCSARNVLDLGSGKGGDLHKYQACRPTSLTLVEPNVDNLNELKDRLKTTNLNTVTTLRSYAEDVKLDRTFQSISLFFMLTFMFKSEIVLDKFISVLDTHLADHGVLVGTTVVGCKLRNLPEDNVRLPDCNIRRTKAFNDTPYGNEVEIDLFGTQTATKQTEWLVDFNTFAQKLAARNIFLSETYHQDSSRLQHGEKLFGESTLGFVFIKNNISILTTIPCPLGSYDAWRLPTPVNSDSFLHCVVLSLLHDPHLKAFVHDNVPYNGCMEQLDEPVSKLKQHLLDTFTLDTYVHNETSLEDLREYLSSSQPTSKKLLDELRQLLLFSDMFKGVARLFALISADVVPEFNQVIYKCFSQRRLNLFTSPKLLASLMQFNLYIYDVNQRQAVCHYIVDRMNSTLCLARINLHHYELIRCSQGHSDTFFFH